MFFVYICWNSLVQGLGPGPWSQVLGFRTRTLVPGTGPGPLYGSIRILEARGGGCRSKLSTFRVSFCFFLRHPASQALIVLALHIFSHVHLAALAVTDTLSALAVIHTWADWMTTWESEKIS